MKLPSSTQQLITLGVLAVAPFTFGNTTLLVNTDFAIMSGEGLAWNAGSNLFSTTGWLEYTTSLYSVDDKVNPSGSGFVFSSHDDGSSDKLENFLFQEFKAGPADTVFSTGDVIVFKGSARATRTGTDTSDMIVRAFVKTLGYNSLGWSNQVKTEYSSFYNITDTLESFELSITYPDLAVDDSLQLIQLGFEITNSWDGAAMDAGTIYFENLEGYVQGDAAETWKGFEVLTGDDDGWADTGDANVGWVYMRYDPILFSFTLNSWFYMVPEANFDGSGFWFYLFK